MSRKLKTAFFVICAAMILLGGLLYGTVLIKHGGQDTHSAKAQAVESAFARQFYEFQSVEGSEALPSFTLYDLQDQKSESRTVIKGGATLVNLWALWCAPCITEIPSLMALEKAMRDKGHNFRVVFISLDDPANGAELIAGLKKFGLENMTGYYAPDADIWGVLKVNALPTSILLSPAGEIQYRITGDTDWTEPVAIQFLNQFLESNNAGS